MWIIWAIVGAGIFGVVVGVAIFSQVGPMKTKAKELLKQQDPDIKEIKKAIGLLNNPMADEESKELVRQLVRKSQSLE
jgi:hypothetical protein